MFLPPSLDILPHNRPSIVRFRAFDGVGDEHFHPLVELVGEIARDVEVANEFLDLRFHNDVSRHAITCTIRTLAGI